MKFRLTGREKSELLGEGILTFVLLVLLNMSLYVIVNQLIRLNPGIATGFLQIKMSMYLGQRYIRMWRWGWIFIAIMAIIDIIVIQWRLTRRYRQMQLRHIITELHYI